MGRIRDVVKYHPEHLPRLCYERCLAALGKIDDKEIDAALDDWPLTSHDPIWLVRQAAVLAEIGRLQEANSRVGPALQDLRFQIGQRPEEIYSLSSEGWAMRLLSNIQPGWPAKEEEHTPRDYPTAPAPVALPPRIGYDPRMATGRTRHNTETVTLELDKQTVRNVKALAAAKKCSVEQFLQGVISQLEASADPFLGMFHDSSEVMDQVVEDAMTARETHPLRQPRE